MAIDFSGTLGYGRSGQNRIRPKYWMELPCNLVTSAFRDMTLFGGMCGHDRVYKRIRPGPRATLKPSIPSMTALITCGEISKMFGNR